MSKVEKQQVPKIRFNQFNDNWLNKSFADCFDIQNGYAYKSSNFVDKKTGKIVLTPGSIALGGGYQADKGRNYSLEAEIPENFIFKSGDIFITLTDLTPSAQALGYPAIVPADDNLYLHNQRLGKIINSKLEEMFLYNLLRRDHYHRYIVSTASGTTVKHSSATAVLSYETRVPEINEQVKIGNFFQQLDKLIDLQSRAVESAEMYKKAMLQKMFPQKGEKVPRVRFAGFSGDWEEKTLDKVAMIVGGGTPDTKVAEYWNGDINWFAPAEIGKYIYAENSTRKITKLGLQKSSAKILPALKTILFTSRAGIGDMAILKVDACTNQGFQSLIVKDGFDVYFIYSMGSFIKQQALRIASGSTFLEISGKALGRILQRYPVVEEQTAIGNFFQKLDQQIEQQAQKLATYQQLKKAMLQRMFV